MFQGMNFEAATLPQEYDQLRQEVRAFLATEKDWLPNSDFNTGASPEFSRRLAAKGWIGMTWPKAYGGGERSFLERYIVTEELLAAGALSGVIGLPTVRADHCYSNLAPRNREKSFCPLSSQATFSSPLVCRNQIQGLILHPLGRRRLE